MNREPMMVRARRLLAPAFTALLLGVGCSGAGSAPTSPPCDQTCQDGVAMYAIRIAMKTIYNVALQGQTVGAQDRTIPCSLGGTAHVHGTATSNPNLGTTTFDAAAPLLYDLTQCHFSNNTDPDPTTIFDITVDGTVAESGVLAQQPGTTTSLTIASPSLRVIGTVYSPIKPYSCTGPLQVSQNGNAISGSICTRPAGAIL